MQATSGKLGRDNFLCQIHVIPRACFHKPLQPNFTAKATSTEGKRPTITSVKPPRQSSPPPNQVPVEPSAIYLLRSRRPPEQEDLKTSVEVEKADFSGNAVEWYLRRLDRSMDEGVAQAPAAAKAYYRASQTPAGNSSVKGVGSAVGVAAKIGVGAIKAAVPLGKWALLQGLSAAGKLASGKKRQEKGND